MSPPSVTRRNFLLGGATAVAATAGGVALNRWSDSPYYADYPMIPENQVSLPKNGRHVLILGAGLSGLISACELLDRGFEVTILEKNATPGGRLRSWRDKGYPIEHGTHAVWSFYNNFREFLGRRGIRLRDKDCNSPYSFMTLAYPDGTVDDRPMSRAPASWHALGIFDDLKALRSRNSLNLSQLAALMSFDPSNRAEVDYLDSVSAAEWMKAIGLSEPFIEAVVDPVFDMAQFEPASKSSALYWHRLTAGMFGHWKDLYRIQFFQDSTQESVIQPLVDYVLKKGGRILFNTAVDQLETSGNRIVRARTMQGSGRHYVCPICGELHEHPAGVCRRCNYSGSDFRRQDGPAREFSADHYLVGLDVPAARKLFSEKPFSADPFFNRIDGVPTSSVIVVYLWYPREASGLKSRWEDHFGRREVIFTSGFPILGQTMNLSVLKEESFEPSGCDVIEVQISRTDRVAGLGNEEICQRVHDDLKLLLPDLPRFMDSRVMRWDNFSSQTVGAEKNRLSMITPYSNLLLLGDHVLLDHNAIYMEKVTVVAKTAVNHLLEIEKIPEGRIRILRSETPNLWVDTVRRVVSVVPG